jgi:hypothetical protein
MKNKTRLRARFVFGWKWADAAVIHASDIGELAYLLVIGATLSSTRHVVPGCARLSWRCKAQHQHV